MAISTKFSFIAGIVFAAACAATPASAQQLREVGPQPVDPLIQWGDMSMGRNQFALSSQQDIEIARFKTPRDIEICLGRPGPGVRSSQDKLPGILITWDGSTGTVLPGNCLSFDAMSVRVKAAGPIPQDDQIIGTFKVIH